MKEGIATDEVLIKALMDKTNLPEKVIKENMKYLNTRVFEIMSEENTHEVRLPGLGVLVENYNMLRKKTFENKSERLNNLYKKKEKSLKSLIDSFPEGETVEFVRRPSFLFRRSFRMSDEDLEAHQNNNL